MSCGQRVEGRASRRRRAAGDSKRLVLVRLLSPSLYPPLHHGQVDVHVHSTVLTTVYPPRPRTTRSNGATTPRERTASSADSGPHRSSEALERVIRARTGRNECRASTGRRAGRVLPSPRLSGRRGAGVAVRTGTKRRPAEVDHTDTGRLRRWGQRKMLTLVCLWGNANSPNRILQASWSARRPQAP